MNSKNVKVVDEHNIDRNASVMFAFDLEGSEYASYSIERDEENSNIFISKVIRNLDNTFNMLDIDDVAEKSKLSDIVKTLISNSVSNENDKLVGDSVTLSDGKVVKFMNVSFNKEQRINVQKTYITTVKKEVVRVAETYYSIDVVFEQPSVVDIFPNVTPVTEPVKEVVPEEVLPVIPEPMVVEPVVVATPTVEVSKVESQVVPKVTPAVVEPITVTTPVVEVARVETTPSVETPVVSVQPSVVSPVETTQVAEQPVEVVPTPSVVVPTPVPAAVPNTEVNQGLVFNAAKETNLNAALGEVANSTSIPVENIEQVREFGVDAPVVNVQPAPVPNVPVTETTDTSVSGTDNTAKNGGFANSKFFMVVAIAFFLASCVFLGYEVFYYFQLTK